MLTFVRYSVKLTNPDQEFEVILNPGEDLMFVIDLQVKLLAESNSQTLEEYKIVSIILLNVVTKTSKPKCLGCIHNQPNQLAHMDPPDGCLYLSI
jgi:uncharacterized protein YpiB (UPF0302 family)